METTKVVFRLWEETEEIIAIFPEVPSSTATPNNCESYTHVGQHGSCSPAYLIGRTKPPSSDDQSKVSALREELKGIGYQLTERRKISRIMHDKRRKAWKQLTQTAE